VIAYKFVKAPLMLALAMVLTFDRAGAYAVAQRAASALAAEGSVFMGIGEWFHAHLTMHAVAASAVIAWLDALTTFAEGTLLAMGRVWGEWVVSLGLWALVPFEAAALAQRPDLPRTAVLIVNAAVAAYLFYRRLRAAGVLRIPHPAR